LVCVRRTHPVEAEGELEGDRRSSSDVAGGQFQYRRKDKVKGTITAVQKGRILTNEGR
jgi:hypothetical protein